MKRAKKRRNPGPLVQDHAPLDHQRKTGVDPVVPVMVTVRKTLAFVNKRPVWQDEEVVRTVRRLVDERLWARFTPEQEHDAAEVFGAWRAVTMGVGMKISDPGRAPGGGTTSVEFNYHLRATWRDWIATCKDRDVDWRIARDMLCIGASAGGLDSFHQRRKGWSIDELLRCLDVWGDVRSKQRGGRVRA